MVKLDLVISEITELSFLKQLFGFTVVAVDFTADCQNAAIIQIMAINNYGFMHITYTVSISNNGCFFAGFTGIV